MVPDFGPTSFMDFFRRLNLVEKAIFFLGVFTFLAVIFSAMWAVAFLYGCFLLLLYLVKIEQQSSADMYSYIMCGRIDSQEKDQGE
jgi:hypothetical protein